MISYGLKIIFNNWAGALKINIQVQFLTPIVTYFTLMGELLTINVKIETLDSTIFTFNVQIATLSNYIGSKYLLLTY
ncbi:hypothetical protein GCM10008918_10240 [Lactobacillus kefiranofaciens subsp. kefiranofaciens]|uniref:Uncharacterized protein n=1 Tax=Lactobacillus kefiranofaciens TaxID=267818 RepID=A0ABY0MEN5_9LACO|nr:hypothetical protein SAMN02983011_02327 [Lactobacillus kefiranofaciens]